MASVEPGTYHEAQDVTLSCDTEGTTIRYTTDGSAPGEGSPIYEGNPIAVGETTTIRAKAFREAMLTSDEAAFEYVIEDEPSPIRIPRPNLTQARTTGTAPTRRPRPAPRQVTGRVSPRPWALWRRARCSRARGWRGWTDYPTTRYPTVSTPSKPRAWATAGCMSIWRLPQYGPRSLTTARTALPS